MCARIGFGIAGGNSLSWASVIHTQNTECPWAKLPGKAGAILRLNNIVGVVQADRGLEIAAVFNKERPHLSEVGRKALVWDRGIVNAHLAEVGVDGGVEDQAVVQDELCIEAGIALEMFVLKIWIVGVNGG